MYRYMSRLWNRSICNGADAIYFVVPESGKSTLVIELLHLSLRKTIDIYYEVNGIIC